VLKVHLNFCQVFPAKAGPNRFPSLRDEGKISHFGLTLFSCNLFIFLFISKRVPVATVILKGWTGPPGSGRNVPPNPGASGGVSPPRLFDIVKSIPEAECRFLPGRSFV
jgi:hypothetical protein